ncbi:multidrug effflux MFS transporter [Corynebacterium pelargi]|uniref:Bicyclomycin resistance protein n=1 Tax=Corynebacterium pelargi TaxID=1471400 RepID=A0A410W6E4_9CORY|nr:multidrug effflux MFS transporter [Corynebacterium pelargi]QAU51598.1 Bicyclomycin resistance protein [Corynebacterium pelargi]GGG79928.1 Bcr/CflA family drug resistance efflux transporter [Corynebacterium pelargi]
MRESRISTGLLAGLALLMASGPFAIDMYLPTLPALAKDLRTPESSVQLTLTAFMVGMALGQLIVGTISDALGRRRLLLVGALLSLISCIACALTPGIGILVAARLLHGLGSGACVVLARAIVPDLARGAEAAKAFTLMMVIQSVAPVAAPVLGGVLASPIGWRGIFWVLVAFSALQVLVVWRGIPETRHQRAPLRIRPVLSNFRTVLANRRFVQMLLAFSFGFGSMFSYISASSFVIQDVMGLSVHIYTLCFAGNALGLMLTGLLNNRLIDRFRQITLLRAGLSVLLLANISLVAITLLGMAPLLYFPALFFCVAPLPMVMGNAFSMGTDEVREYAGSASSLMGFVQFLVAGIATMLVGIGGNMALSMGLSMALMSAIAFFASMRVPEADPGTASSRV